MTAIPLPNAEASYIETGVMMNEQVVDGYPGYEASILASNDFFRSTSASLFPLFGTVFFVKLGLGPACTLLAGVSVILIIALYVSQPFGFRSRFQFRRKLTSR